MQSVYFTLSHACIQYMMYMYIYLLASMQKYYKRYMYVPGAYETHLASRSYDPIHVYTLVLVLFAVINFTL